jgi:hypothetical protein
MSKPVYASACTRCTERAAAAFMRSVVHGRANRVLAELEADRAAGLVEDLAVELFGREVADPLIEKIRGGDVSDRSGPASRAELERLASHLRGVGD